MRYSRFEDLPVWKAGARLFVRIDQLCGDSELCKRGDIADQLHRAALSITNNIAEGFEQGTNQQLITYLYYARGSAGEVRTMLQQMLAIPRLAHLKPETLSLRSHAEEVSKQLRGFADSLQNSEIEGQRYLTDATRDETDRKARRAAFEKRIADIMAQARDKWRSTGATEPSPVTKDAASAESAA